MGSVRVAIVGVGNCATSLYYRYIWLVDLIKDVGCNEAAIYESHPFLVKDVLFSAILVRANEALLEIAEVAGASDAERSLIQEWINVAGEGWKSAGTPSSSSAWTTICGPLRCGHAP